VRKNLKNILLPALIILIVRGPMMADSINDSVVKETFENGLTVIVKENHSAPVAACNFWVRAGAANENAGEKGLSHFLEHMMFKGTQKRGMGAIDKEIKDLGGYNNAFTSYDATNYVIVLPSENVNKALDIEYDALTGSVFDPGEFNKEREVILDELYKGQDNPGNFLWQKLMKLNFDSYYEAPIIGYDTNLKGYTRQSLVDYYDKYYLPGNMVVVVSGDVDAKKTIDYVRQTFGQIEPKKTGIFCGDRAPESGGFKYLAVSGDIESRYLAVGFRIPDALSKDTPKLEILARVLGSSESSILYRVLKEEKGLVDEIDADMFSGKFGGIFVISATVREGKFEETLKSIFEELSRVREEGIRAEDVNKVKSDIIREKAKEEMKVENAAMDLGYYESLSDYTVYYDYYDRLKRVIESDLTDIMNEYLTPERAGMVLYYPEKMKDEFKKYQAVGDVKKLIAPKAGAKKKAAEGEIRMAELSNGIKFIHKKLSNTDIVAAKFVFTGGVLYEGSAYGGSARGITNLMQEVMLKGTDKLGAKEIAEQIDRLGVVLSKEISKDHFGWSAEMVSGNFDPFMELFSGILLKPAFDLNEIKKEKEDITNSINRLKDNPAAYCSKLYNEEFFEWHPYGFYIPGTPETIKGTPSKYIKEWHDRYLTPNNLIVSVVGNIDFDAAKDMLEKRFKDWPQGNLLKASLPVKITLAKKEKRETINKNQSHILIGFLGPKTNSEDYYTFRLIDAILSGGMDSRLFAEIRDKKNLCYTIYSNFDRYIENGSFKIYVATAPENEKTVIEEIFKLLRELKEKGVTDDEVKSAKTYINGMFKIGFQDFMGQADSYSMYEFWGLGYKKVDTFLDKIYGVKKSEINAAIRKYLNFDECTQVVVGPAQKNGKTK
jgi:zinc protease